jgi:arsenite methyltransferase
MNDPNKTHDLVRNAYADVARKQSSCCGPKTSCCNDTAYTVPDHPVPEAELGLSCGNPVAFSHLKPGDVVLDLGSGAGKDVFLAAQKVGDAGRAIGVDMTPEMLSKARRNAVSFREQTGLDNVEFRLGEIEHLPVADGSVDVVISNCVINLSPDKPQVWREVARVLKPGGRVAVSDLALLQPLPPALRESADALVGCIAGAVLVRETEAMVKAAGLTGVELSMRPEVVDAMACGLEDASESVLAGLPAGRKPSDYVTSLYVSARKPAPVRAAKGRI